MSNKLVIHSSLDTFVQNQLSERTKTEYRRDLQHFRSWYGAPLIDADTRVLIEYRNYLSRRYAPSTTNRMLSTIRSGYQWLHNQGIVSHDPSKAVKLLPGVDNATTPALSDGEARKLLRATKGNVRDECIITVLLYMGLRRSELVNIKYSDISIERDGTVLTVIGKGKKTRRIPIPSVVEKALHRNTNLPHRNTNLTYIFTSQRASKLHPETVRKIVKKYCALAGIKEVSPHSLRATATSNAIDQGCNYIELQYAMGWSSPDMVNRYDKRRGEIKNSAVWKINYGGEK